MMKDEDIKNSVKSCLCITGDYSPNEILQALLMKDREKLGEMQERCIELQKAYKEFVQCIDGDDKDKRDKAINTFRRPEKKGK
jgi:hypothetical protein